jgi:hypothetical protein
MIINLDIVSWQVGLIILLILIFFLYLFFGGGNYEYIGLSPLEIGYDASRQVKHSKNERSEHNEYSSVNEDEQENEGPEINHTPIIPDLSNINVPDKKEVEIKNFFCSSGSQSYENPSMSNLVCSPSTLLSNESSSELSEENIAQTPRTRALGPYKCYNAGQISKGERLCKQAIEEITGKIFHCIRPDFLKNPETGRNLELDLYNDELKIGLEYQGVAHYLYPNPFHKTREEFINAIRRDQFKVNTCDANGVYLISVPYNVPLNLEEIKRYITYYMPENAHLRT